MGWARRFESKLFVPDYTRDRRPGTQVGGNRRHAVAFEETQETLALLKILALSAQEIEAGLEKPIVDVAARLRAKRSAE
jgi:hypothetical protein